jgi:asparagine synthase (glutamine-hydrolysing)
MCGFAGVLDATGKRRDELGPVVQAMAETLRHRGPDDRGVWVDEAAGVAVGFRRLAILDLSAAGHQPMASRDGQFILVLNGEIYNHLELRPDVSVMSGVQWAGHSDTETLLACFGAWGVRKTLERTVGMFALAVWDRRERRLHLARDRFGEKPLYYGWSRGAFLFGSEPKALRPYPGFDNPIDPDVLALYMQYSAVPEPYSIYKNIYKLEPGCVLSLSLADAATPLSHAPFAPAREAGLTLERYWSLADVVQRGLDNPLHDEREATDRLEAALADAVRLQLLADVPLGAFLSGGIDSSTIVALMQAQSSRRMKTFTIGFDEAGFNEAEHAAAVARHLGTDHTELYVSAQQTRDVIPRLPDLYSEPFADSSQVPTHLVSCIARQQVTVALSGDGGDEMLGGYTRFLWAPRVWNRLGWMPSFLRRTLGGTIERVPIPAWDALGNAVPPHISRLGDKAHKLASRLKHANNVDDLYRILVTIWDADAGVVRGAGRVPTVLDMAMARQGAPDPEHRMMFMDALTYLPDVILHKVDRASMAVGLETRAPFLDHRVAELAWRLPVGMKIRNGQGKWILRQLLDRHVPKKLIERPKMGFSIPVDAWIRGPLREWAEDLMSESTLRSGGYLNPVPVREKWAEHLSGRRNWQNELWCVLMFQAWLASEKSSGQTMAGVGSGTMNLPR